MALDLMKIQIDSWNDCAPGLTYFVSNLNQGFYWDFEDLDSGAYSSVISHGINYTVTPGWIGYY